MFLLFPLHFGGVFFHSFSFSSPLRLHTRTYIDTSIFHLRIIRGYPDMKVDDSYAPTRPESEALGGGKVVEKYPVE